MKPILCPIELAQLIESSPDLVLLDARPARGVLRTVQARQAARAG